MKSILVAVKSLLFYIVTNVHLSSVLIHTMQAMAAVDLVLIDRSEIQVYTHKLDKCKTAGTQLKNTIKHRNCFKY